MNVLLAYDGSVFADLAVDDLEVAGMPRSAQAIVLSVVEQGTHAPQSYGMVESGLSHGWTGRVAAAEQSAEAVCNRLQSYFPQWDIRLETRSGNPAAVILDKASAWPADLTVVGTHDRSGLARVVLGSVSLKVVREASCSVRVARAGVVNGGGAIRLLIGNDGSSEADTVVVSEVCRRSWAPGTEARILAVHEFLAPINSERIAMEPDLYRQVNEDERIRLSGVATRSAERLQVSGLIASPMVKGEFEVFSG
jgi:nucleotide-binding universal stress UspA family protein